MPVKVNFSDDTESKLENFQQALTMNDCKIKVQACDGIVVSSALHIASGWVRDTREVTSRRSARSCRTQPRTSA